MKRKKSWGKCRAFVLCDGRKVVDATLETLRAITLLGKPNAKAFWVEVGGVKVVIEFP